MKMKKRIIALLLAVLLAVGLTGCKDVLKGIVHKVTGTSDEVQLCLLPLRWRDVTMYGLCGVESSESYFKQNFAQPTGFDRLSCLLAPAGEGLAADAALSSGTTGGYYHAPRNTLMQRSMGGGQTQLPGPARD